jgi:hypothetical protein
MVTPLAIEEQFLGNHEARTLYLDTQFHNFIQGDLSIDSYYRKMKAMVDDLSDLGAHVDDRTLVLNLMRGLNKYDSLKMVLKRTK